MARRGENIRKRKDGRWEGRYIKGRKPDRTAIWGYVYGHSYSGLDGFRPPPGLRVLPTDFTSFLFPSQAIYRV